MGGRQTSARRDRRGNTALVGMSGTRARGTFSGLRPQLLLEPAAQAGQPSVGGHFGITTCPLVGIWYKAGHLPTTFWKCFNIAYREEQGTGGRGGRRLQFHCGLRGAFCHLLPWRDPYCLASLHFSFYLLTRLRDCLATVGVNRDRRRRAVPPRALLKEILRSRRPPAVRH